ncbi:MAG: cytochrome c maturation protein CcmE [Terracidiphilus sp.]
MKLSPNTLRIWIGVVVILGTIGCLVYTTPSTSKSYFVKVPELLAMGDLAHKRNLRLDGFVQPGSIQQNGTHVDFVLNEFESHSPKAATGRVLKVVYNGSEPPPDTFKDDSEAIAEGTYGRDGVFYATGLQAKCASKYAPQQPGATPSTPAGAKPSTASNAAPAPAPPTQTAAN